jgi:hypothetical protein
VRGEHVGVGGEDLVHLRVRQGGEQREAAGPDPEALVRLSQETGDTAFLSVARDVYAICLHREDGAYPLASVPST